LRSFLTMTNVEGLHRVRHPEERSLQDRVAKDAELMTDPRLAAAKATLRLDARARRKALMVEHPEADWMAADHAGAMLTATGRPRPGVVALYKALGAELEAWLSQVDRLGAAGGVVVRAQLQLLF
jgi:hypothetical protein